MFDCRRITLFCLENASQSTKWLFFKNFGGHGPFAPHPCLRLCPRVSLENLHVFLMHYTVKKQINNLEYARVVYPSRTAKAQIFVFWDNFGRNSSTDCPRAVVLKLFLIAYHLCVPYCHHVPPCSRKSQCAKYHSIKSLENQNWQKCNVNKMAVRNFNGRF